MVATMLPKNILRQEPCFQHIAKSPVLEAWEHVDKSGTCSYNASMAMEMDTWPMGLSAICLDIHPLQASYGAVDAQDLLYMKIVMIASCGWKQTQLHSC